MFSDISARAQENFSGARLIRAYVQEEAEIRRSKKRTRNTSAAASNWFVSWACYGLPSN